MTSATIHRPLAQTAFNRRVALKAAAGFAAMAAPAVAPLTKTASAAGATVAQTWTEADHPDVQPDGDGWITFALDAPFSALAPAWDAEGGSDALVEFAIGADGINWTDAVTVGAAISDAGPPDRDGRLFGDLTFADGATWVSYRALRWVRGANHAARIGFRVH